MSINQNDADGLEQAQCLVRYDPGIVKYAWSRRHHGQRRYSLCGIAHASATDTVMDMFGHYLTAPLQKWDALICPSESIRAAALSVVDGWRGYVKDRFGVAATCPMEFPVIPLGVDTIRFAHLGDPEKRASQRQALGVGEDEIVILYVGRLNYLAKANPLPLLLAAEQVAGKSETPIRVVFNGYFNDEMNETAFNQAVGKITNKAQVSFVRHGDTAYPDGLWAGADIFCSLSDNIQESFGLTPVEAMAAGLPVIASDWNGYRDTVRDGVDGFSIPTMMPSAGNGGDMAYRYFAGQYTYGDYLGATSQSTAVDMPVLVEALTQLASDPALRKKMGASGRQRAIDKFEWSRVIRAYEKLWLELAVRRNEAPETAPPGDGGSFHPSRPDPFQMFGSFPSRAYAADGCLTLAVTDWQDAVVRMQLKMGLIYPGTLIELEELPVIFGHLELKSECSIAELAAAMGSTDLPRIILTAGWLVKLGICHYHPPKG